MEAYLEQLESITLNEKAKQDGSFEAFLQLYKECVTSPRTVDEFGMRLDQIAVHAKTFLDLEGKEILKNALDEWYKVADLSV